MKRNYTFLLTLFVILVGCNKEIPDNDVRDTKNIIVVGEKTENGIFSEDFEPIIIEREYHGGTKVIRFMGQTCLLIENSFTVSLGNMQEINYRNIQTLNSCSLKTDSTGLAFYDQYDTVETDIDFQAGTFKYGITGWYLVFKFRTDKKYVGWIQIKSAGSSVIINDYCLYELK